MITFWHSSKNQHGYYFQGCGLNNLTTGTVTSGRQNKQGWKTNKHNLEKFQVYSYSRHNANESKTKFQPTDNQQSSSDRKTKRTFSNFCSSEQLLKNFDLNHLLKLF